MKICGKELQLLSCVVPAYVYECSTTKFVKTVNPLWVLTVGIAGILLGFAGILRDFF